MRRADRQRGTLLGLAVGDALGAAVEFEHPGTFEPVAGYRGGGPHGLPPGAWTDDTSMALALADSIAEAGWDINDQAQRYLKWWRTGAYSVNGRCFDIGITTATSLQRFEKTRDARTSGDVAGRSSGNGSIMRLAPVPTRRRVEARSASRRDSQPPNHRESLLASVAEPAAILHVRNKWR